MKSLPTRSQPVQLGSRTDKRVVGKGRGDSAAVLQSDYFKFSHNWSSLFVNCTKSCSPLAFYNPTTVDGKVTINPPAEAVVEGVGLWEGSLVGQFFDKRLPLHVVWSSSSGYGASMKYLRFPPQIMGCTYSGLRTWMLGIGY